MRPPTRKQSGRSLSAQLLLRPTIWFVKFLRKRYSTLTERYLFKQSNSHLNQLIFLQSLIYYFKVEFKCWGFFHPNCVRSEHQRKYVKYLFPLAKKDLGLVLIHHPDAVTYYHNKMYDAGDRRWPNEIANEISKQLIKWETPVVSKVKRKNKRRKNGRRK